MPLFEDVDTWALEETAKLFELQYFQPNEALVQEGGMPSEFFIMIAGAGNIVKTMPDGNISILFTGACVRACELGRRLLVSDVERSHRSVSRSPFLTTTTARRALAWPPPRGMKGGGGRGTRTDRRTCGDFFRPSPPSPIHPHSLLSPARAGDYFGELGLMKNQPRQASVRSLAGTAVIVADKKGFDRMLDMGGEKVQERIQEQVGQQMHRFISRIDLFHNIEEMYRWVASERAARRQHRVTPTGCPLLARGAFERAPGLARHHVIFGF